MPNIQTDVTWDSKVTSKAIDEHRRARFRANACQRFATGILCVMGIPLVGATLYEVLTHSHLSDNWQRCLNPLFIACTLTCFLPIGMFVCEKRKQKAVLKVVYSDDIAVLGMLVEQIGSGEIYRRDHVARAIMRLLPNLNETNSDVLKPRHWKLLCKTLDPNLLITFSASQLNVEYFIVVLETMAAIGDHSTLPAVQRLATLAATNAGQARVKQHAVELLLKMQERLARQSVADGILRPIVEGGDALLRPIQASNQSANGSELLRPHTLSSRVP